MAKLTSQKEDKVVQYLVEGKTLLWIAERLGIGERTVSRIKVRRNVTVRKDIVDRPGKKVTADLGLKSGSLDIDVTHPKGKPPRWLNIENPEQLLKACDIDNQIWRVNRARVSSSEVTMKLRDRVDKLSSDKPKTFTNVHVSVQLERRAPSDTAILTVIDRLQKKTIKPVKVKYKRVTKEPVMLEWCPFDQHHGLMTWDKEVEASWDLKLSEAFFQTACQKVIQKASPYNVAQIVVPIGQDWFHCNDATFQTPGAKHRLDMDGRLIKIYETGFWSLLKAIEQLRQIAPVHLMWVPGNHDEQTSFYLAHSIRSTYMDTDGQFRRGVTVDVTPRSRKLYTFGNSAIGFSHPMNRGLWEKQRGVFAELFKAEWAAANHHEIHTGHLHKKMELQYMQADTLGSHTVVRMLPSLCASDKWHYEMGFLDKNRASSSFIWSEGEGLVCQFTTRVTDEEAQRR